MQKNASGTVTRAGRVSKSKKEALDLALALRGCSACPLNTATDLESPKMLPTGTTRPLVYVLGEGPGAEEDRQGEQFVGKSGQLLRERIPRRFQDRLRWQNVVRCRPPENRDPTPMEMACCRQYQIADIEKTKPVAIFGFGDVPLRWVTGLKAPRITIWRGRRIPVRVGTHTCWFYPMFHPAYILRIQNARDDGESGGKETRQVFDSDLARAFAEVERGLPDAVVESPDSYGDGIEVVGETDTEAFVKVTSFLRKLLKQEYCGFDIETTGYRPYFPERRILTMSFSTYDETISFPYDHPRANWGKEKGALKHAVAAALSSSRLRKVCQNVKFEMEWVAEEFGEEVVWNGVWEDTLAQAYLLDERQGANGLDDLTIQRLGFNVKSLSQVRQDDLVNEPLCDVLRYNGLDAKYTYPVFFMQAEDLEREGLVDVYRQHVRYSFPLVLAQRRGIMVDQEEVRRTRKQYLGLVSDIDSKICSHKDILAFGKSGVFPKNAQGNPYEPGNNHHVLAFFKDFLKCSECNIGTRKKPAYSSKEEVLVQIKHPVAAWTLERRGLMGVASKNIFAFSTDHFGTCRPGKCDPEHGHFLHADSLIHTTYNHCRTATRRISSDGPNQQNWPKHDPEQKKIRLIVKASKGQWMGCFDYGQLEARVLAMASHDKFLVQALYENYDIHGEWAERIMKAQPRWADRIVEEYKCDPKDKKKIMKEARQEAKNRWVFPLFFGSVLESVSTAMFLEPKALKPLFEEFWNSFPGIREWQEKTVKFSDEYGYVETLSGFRRHAPMKYNEKINTPIQGTAAEIVMDAMCELAEKSHELKIDEYQPRLMIHDDLSTFISDERLEESVEFMARTMCCRDLPFINVPLIVEATVGPNWYEQEEIGKWSSVTYGYPRKAATSSQVPTTRVR